MLKRCEESENRIVLEPANNKNAGIAWKKGRLKATQKVAREGKANRLTEAEKIQKKQVSMLQAKDSSLSERPVTCNGGD